ncbi:MAG: DUF805 domain-containing protein [Pseudomonas sp.]|uniref:DUF805 domain-containing protein n=1 Tax=Pseudomonas sp. TaxID=306 RepID=UPI003398D75D
MCADALDFRLCAPPIPLADREALMTDARYKIVFTGELLPDISLDTAKDNLAQLFKSDRSKIDGLFSGAAVALKRDLPDAEADKYLSVLHNAGIKVQKEPDLSAKLSLVELDDPASKIVTARMTCPKCGHEQLQAVECAACGIVVDKFIARQALLAKSPKPEPMLTASPYTPPQADVAEPQAEFGTLKVLGVQGRIGRVRYLAWSMGMLLACVPVFGIAAASMMLSDTLGFALIGLTVLFMAMVSICIGVQRLHDMGLSGWLWLLNFVPFVGSIFALVMLFAPGSSGANNYGPPPPPNGRGVVALAWAMLLVPLIGILAAIALPAYQDYINRTEAAAQSAVQPAESASPFETSEESSEESSEE